MDHDPESQDALVRDQCEQHTFFRIAHSRADLASFFAYLQIYGRTIPEQKVLVSFGEVVQAESILHELEIFP